MIHCGTLFLDMSGQAKPKWIVSSTNDMLVQLHHADFGRWSPDRKWGIMMLSLSVISQDTGTRDCSLSFGMHCANMIKGNITIARNDTWKWVFKKEIQLFLDKFMETVSKLQTSQWNKKWTAVLKQQLSVHKSSERWFQWKWWRTNSNKCPHSHFK